MDRPEFIMSFTAIMLHPDSQQNDSVVYGYIYWLSCLKMERCFAANSLLAELSGYSEGGVQNSLTRLEKNGFIRRIYKENKPVLGREEIIPLLRFQAFRSDDRGVSPILGEGYHQNEQHTIKKSIKEDTAEAVFVITEEKPEKPQKVKDSATRQYDALCSWLSDLTGAPMPNRAKQYTHLAAAKKADITPTRLKNRAEELWGQEYYQNHGMDWGSVVSSFNRKA